MINVHFYDAAKEETLQYAVIVAKYKGDWVFCKHKERNTYEFPGGRREPGEDILETAKRELYEETGAKEYQLKKIGVYSVERTDGKEREESFGMLYYADIITFGPLPDFEIESVAIMEDLPQSWTYPLIQPKLLDRIKEITSLYFVRHAQPDFRWEDDRTRPLTEEGKRDAKKVAEVLLAIPIDCAFSSPYQRSVDTIQECANRHGLNITKDERLRERKSGKGMNYHEMIRKRWADFTFHEEGGESLSMVQERNIDAVVSILKAHRGESVLIGTHGTALAVIMNYYHPDFQADDFFRIIDFMPYIIRLDFDGERFVGQEELFMIEKVFKERK